MVDQQSQVPVRGQLEQKFDCCDCLLREAITQWKLRTAGKMSKLHDLVNCSDLWDKYCGQLSLRTSSGKSCIDSLHSCDDSTSGSGRELNYFVKVKGFMSSNKLELTVCQW